MAESWGEDDEVDDWGAADEVAESVEPAPAPEAEERPWYRTELGDEISSGTLGALETAGSMVTGALAEPVAGVLGAAGAMVPGEAGQGARVVEGVREALTYKPQTEAGQAIMGGVGEAVAPVGEVLGAVESGMGEAVLEATGSELLATVAHTLPTAALEALGIGLLKEPSKAAMRVAKAQARRKLEPTLDPEQVARDAVEPELKTSRQIIEDVRANKAKEVAAEVRPDQQLLDDAEELGVDLNPSHYSTNEAYKRVEQQIKASPKGGHLADREITALEKLSEEADKLIDDIGGQTDYTLLDERVRSRFDGAINRLTKQSDAAYAKVNDALNKPGMKPRVKATASQRYLDQRLEDMGGDITGLSTAEKKLYDVLDQERPPTYGRFDELRRDIGEGFKNRGEFADNRTANLSGVYEALIRDQQGVADAFGVGETLAAGRKLVANRKTIEKQAQKLFGKEMNKSLVDPLTGAAKKLTKGSAKDFDRLLKMLPTKALRAEAAASMLHELFVKGATTRSGKGIGHGFASAYESLNRHKGAKAVLFKHLDADAQRRFDSIGRVSSGIYRAKQLENTSGTARTLLHALEDLSLVEKVTSSPAARIGARVPGAGMVGLGLDTVSAAAKGGASRIKKADDLLSSPAFNNALGKAMEGKVKQAESMLKRSKVWQAWRRTLGEGTRKQLEAMGAIAWLTQRDEQQPPAEGAAVGQ